MAISAHAEGQGAHGRARGTAIAVNEHLAGDMGIPGPVDSHGDVPLVPEPATLTLLGLGALGVLIRARRRRR